MKVVYSHLLLPVISVPAAVSTSLECTRDSYVFSECLVMVPKWIKIAIALIILILGIVVFILFRLGQGPLPIT